VQSDRHGKARLGEVSLGMAWHGASRTGEAGAAGLVEMRCGRVGIGAVRLGLVRWGPVRQAR
jgi:hypothetical protein